jgi:hypothetical protein
MGNRFLAIRKKRLRIDGTKKDTDDIKGEILLFLSFFSFIYLCAAIKVTEHLYRRISSSSTTNPYIIFVFGCI